MRILCSLFFGLLFSLGINAASLDASLGSMVGDVDTPSGANIPFHVQLSHSVDLGPVAIGPMIGHQSSADRNGNEYSGEYYGLTASTGYQQLYLKADTFKFYDNDDESEGITNYRVEIGVSDAVSGFPIRLGVFYQEAIDGLYRAQGVNLGYTFGF